MHLGPGKREVPAVNQPQGTAKKGNSEVTVIPNVSDTKTEPVNIKQTKNLDNTDAVNNQIKVTAGTSTQSGILSLIVSDYEMSDSDFDNNVLGNVSDFSEHVSNLANLQTNLLTMTDEDVNETPVSLVPHSISSIKPVPLKSWKPSSLPTHAVHQLAQHRIYRGNDKVQKPRRAVRIPVKTSTFGGKFKEPLTTRPVQQPWAQLSIDTVVSQTRTKRGNTCIIVVQDLYTKYIELFPVRNRLGRTIVKVLDTLFDRWGAPRSIMTDNGTEYVNKEVKAFLQARGVEHLNTPLAHPQGNPVERTNRTIKPMIAAFINGNHNEWDANLSKIQFAYNTVPHTGSRISPFYLNHGREAAPKHIPKPTDKILTDSDDSLNYWVKRLSQIDEFRHKVEQNLKKYSEKRLEKLNADKTTMVKIKEGTEIYYPNKKLSNKAQGYAAKLGHRFLGPAYVKRVLNPMVVEIADKTDKIIGVYYVTDLKIPKRSLRKQNSVQPTDGAAIDDTSL